ncbi:MAG: RES family NAD+ phosphorylase [Gammaproteobacteria bacterium]
MSSPRTLAEPLRTYRIGDGKGTYPVYSAEGARLATGRWNTTGQAVIYTSEHHSTAVLEKLVRLGEMPPNQHYIEVTIPTGICYEEIADATVPGWYEKNCLSARAYGARWYREQRSAILIVPSVVARLDMNVLINTQHKQFSRIKASRERAIWWDDRLFART